MVIFSMDWVTWLGILFIILWWVVCIWAGRIFAVIAMIKTIDQLQKKMKGSIKNGKVS